MKWWLLVVVPLWVTMILCTHWEPVTRDGWGHLFWHTTNPTTPTTLWEVLRDDWWDGNPRLGQMLTYPLYAPGPWHAIVTPIVELSLFYVLTVLALGRWPSPRRADDALAFATVFAIAAIATPELGSMLFYRPYVGNYLLGALFSALWLVPYRLHYEQARTPRGWWAPAMCLLGAAAGNSNEHTGPAMLVIGVVAIAMIARRGERVRAWMITGLLGMLAGYLLLYFAPGQHARYNGLADQQGLGALVASRGLAGNLAIVAKPFAYFVQAIPWVGVALVSRTERMPRLRKHGMIAALIVAGLCTLALLGSPKLGARLYLATVLLGTVALASWVVRSPARRVLAALAGLVIAFVCLRCVMVFASVADEGERRTAKMLASKPGDHLVFHAYPQSQHWFDTDIFGHKRWFNGEDFALPGPAKTLASFWQVSVTLER